MIAIAIDGPSAAGKSTVAKLIAQRLNYVYVDTGALYRGIGYYCVNKGIKDTKNKELVVSELKNINLKLQYIDKTQHLILNDNDVSAYIRTPEVSMAASNVSAIPEVRTFLVDLQRNMAENNNVVMDGRDIGTVILPNAQVKIFLTASDEARAKRRMLEYEQKGEKASFDEVLKDLKARDKQDSERATAPLKQASDAHFIDNSNLSLEETADLIISYVK